MALQQKDITIYGDGSQTRSFCYLNDLVDGFVRLMATGDTVTGPINLGNPNEFTIKQLAETVIEKTNSSSKIIYYPLPADGPKQRQPDITQARELLAWRPTIALREGPADTIHFFDGLLKGDAKQRSQAAPRLSVA